MRFQGNNSPKAGNLTTNRSVSLPRISPANPETKMHFKGIEEMGNKLKSKDILS